MKKQTFIVGAIILTIGGFVAKIIGAFYKIPLTNILGSSGMGIYYLVFPLYNLMLVLSSSGVSIAVTKLVAKSRANKLKRNETTYLKVGLLISFVSSFIFSFIMFIFAKQLAYQQGNILSYLGFMAISPAIVSASLVTVIKGYFQGIENMIPSSIAMIVEQIIKMVVGLLLSFQLLPYGIEYAVMGSVLAVTISETVTLVIMLINYFWHKKYNDKKFYKANLESLEFIEIKSKLKLSSTHIYKKPKRPARKRKIYYLHSCVKLVTFKDAVKQTLSILLPNTLMSLVMPLITLIDSFLVINLLTKAGYSSYTATSLYGINNGVVSSLVSLPVIVTSALSTAVVPNLSGLVQTKDKFKIAERTSFFLKITWIIALPICIYFLTMSDQIISALYNFSTNSVINEYGFASKLLMLSSISIIYNAMLSTLISILQAINKPYKVFFVLLGAMIIRTILSIVLIQNIKINIFGTLIANVVFLLISVCGCILILRNNIEIRLNMYKFFIIPLIVSVISGGAVYYISQLLYGINVWFNLIVCGITLVGLYVVLIISLRCFEKHELKYLPFLKGK